MRRCGGLGLARVRRGERGFSIPELMIAATITLLVVGGVITTQIFGLRMFELTSSKVTASQDARQAINLLMDDVRAAKKVKVGSGTLATFTAVSGSSLRQGNAILLTMSTNTNLFVRYFVDTSTKTLRRTTNGTTTRDLVTSITNSLPFAMENYRGETLTNNANNSVLSVTLQMDPLGLTALRRGTGSYYSGYQIRTRVSHRAIE